MGRQLWLVDVLRAAGLTVEEVSGWESRGSADYAPEGLIAHDTGSSSTTTTDAGEISVMIHGRRDLPGPIGQLYVSRTGVWHVVTAGRSNHALEGWGGPYRGLGNRRLLGIEAQHKPGELWSATQYWSYVRGVAAILRHTGWPTVAGHKEHQPGAKTDPGFDMDRFRADVRAVMSGDSDMRLYRVDKTPEVWAYDGVGRRHVPDEATLRRVKAATGAVVVVLASASDLDLIAPPPAPPARVTDEQLVRLADLLAERVGRVATPAEIAVAVADEDHRRSEG